MLRMTSDLVETLEAFEVLRSRAEELSERIDQAYETTERDEVELETILDTMEAAAHETADAEDEGDLDSNDASTDDDDTDMDFAASLCAARPGRGQAIQRLAIRGSAAQGKAEQLLWLSPREVSHWLKRVAVSAHPELSRHNPAGA